MEAIASAVKAGRLQAELSFVGSDRADAQGLKTASEMGFDTAVLPYASGGREAGERRLGELCRERNVEWIVLAGFMRLLSPEFVRSYERRIVNIHPSLLPSFPGKDGIGDAWRRGVTVTGVTVHLVDEGMDSGPIVAQKAVPIYPGDSMEDLERRIHRVEHALYWRTLSGLFSGEHGDARRR